jgi:hypothetical protein|tara:strand:+ start:1282 stop:1842 length:561 start_codon:yes stop_codon:yes gene_type:complete
MKIYLSDQSNRFQKHLEALKPINIIPYNKKLLTHKSDSIELDCNFPDFNFKEFFNYRIFPSNILSAYPQWIHEGRSIQVGDTIVQQINIPPFERLTQRIIVGVRIKEVFNSDKCKGFSYETLQGHVEKGISLFQVEHINNKTIFRIETYSEPAQPMLKLFQPFSSWYQDCCTKMALKNITSSLKLK